MRLFIFSTFLFLFSGQIIYSQKIQTTLPDTLSNWEKKNEVGFDISQISFVNWNAGGNNSISGLLKGDFIRKFKTNKIIWQNELFVRYGVNKQDGVELRKTDDALRINSTFGFRNDTVSKWYHSAKFNFNTQFTNGYSYPNTEIAISRAFAPAYIFLGIGAEYVDKKKKINVYLSPLTQKTTLVLDQGLANQGAFGVEKAVFDSAGTIIHEGRKSRTELGALITSMYKKEVWKNINMENRISVYTDYLRNFGNIDVDWQLQFDLIVNEYVRANIGTHLLYDDDIKAKKEIDGQQITVGPRVQLKQLLGIGLVYNFK